MTAATHRRMVFIVEDDAAVRDALSLVLSLRGFATAMFATAEDFLRALGEDWRGVVVADIRMPGMSGLDLQAALAGHPARLPVIIITGHGDINAARQALKAGGIDFLEKPVDDERLVEAIERAFALAQAEAAHPAALEQALSAREREVMGLVVRGLDNRGVAQALGISPRTVEVHKARVMDKLGAGSLADLMRIARRLNIPAD